MCERLNGCNLYDNKFITEMECEESCVKIDPALCHLRVDPGPCKENFRFWYHDNESRECKKFNYGGCMGNQNKFLRKFDCEKHCITNNKTVTM